MKVSKEVKKMIERGWCIDCNGKLQLCIRAGQCYTHSDAKEEEEDEQETV